MKYGDTLTFKINTVFKSLNKEYTIRKGDIATLYNVQPDYFTVFINGYGHTLKFKSHLDDNPYTRMKMYAWDYFYKPHETIQSKLKTILY